MKNLLPTSLAIVATTVAAQAPEAARAGGIGTNYIGPTVNFAGSSSNIGVNSKLGIADHISLRPFVNFPSGGTNFGTSITYDWDLRQSPAPITPFIGAGIQFASGSFNTNTTGFAQAGLDLNVSDNFSLLANVNIPLSSNNAVTTATVGAALRF
jgi:opacity protein-like surface antigen